MTARADEILDSAALNRALLARQMLLHRVDVPILEVVEHLVGLQAQAPMPPYYGLWSRLGSFDPHALGRMLTERQVVRLTLMRGTIHLVTVRDAGFLRPLLQAAIERKCAQVVRRLGDVGPQRLKEVVRELLADGPLTTREIARGLVERGVGGDDDVVALGHVIAGFVALVQVPPRGVWGSGGQARYAAFESWTGATLDADPSIDDLVLRYLGAFGPASVMDMQNWSGLTKLKPVFERLRPRLAAFRDEDGNELFDLPEAPRPGAEVPAPIRLLGEYDNVLLGHRDRRRIIPADFPWAAMLAHGRYVNNLLVDGMLRATWWIEREGKRGAILGVRPFGELTPAQRAAIAEEATRMLDLVAADASTRDVRFEAAVG